MNATRINALGKWQCTCPINTAAPWIACRHIRAAREAQAAENARWEQERTAPGFFYNPESDYR